MRDRDRESIYRERGGRQRQRQTEREGGERDREREGDSFRPAGKGESRREGLTLEETDVMPADNVAPFNHLFGSDVPAPSPTGMLPLLGE